MPWITALMLSPGVMFAVAYLLVWIATNLYLNHTFRAQLQNAVNNADGHCYRLSIASLTSGPAMNSLILKRLELETGTAGHCLQEPQEHLSLTKLEIPAPDLCLIILRPRSVEISVKKTAREILSHMTRQETDVTERPAPSSATGSMRFFREDL
jgi:hypothetical protein